jgi:hypothetical protein
MHALPVAPAVSIVMPVRDAAATLPAALTSIGRQSLADWELVAVDDGSTDDSAGILRDMARADPRVRVIEGPPQGIVGALATGLASARAPLVARMDADDVMHPARLALQVAALSADPSLALVATRAVLFPRSAVRDGSLAYLAWSNAVCTPADVGREIYVESPFVHPTVLMRRSAVDAVGGYRDGPFPEDYDLWLRVFAAGRAMAKVPRVLLGWREAPARATRTDPRYARAAFDGLRAAFLACDERLAAVRTGERDLVIWGAGRRTRGRAAHLLGRLGGDAGAIAPAAWVDIDPRKIGQQVGGAPVVAPGWLAGRAGAGRPRPFVLVYVTNHGARPLIEAELAAAGYRLGEDALFVG